MARWSSPRSRAARTPATPRRDGRRGFVGQERGRAKGFTVTAVGEDSAGAGQPRGHRLPGEAGLTEPLATRLGIQHRSATAARPASATAGRCPSRGRRPIRRADLVVTSVLSGNRNFEGRVNPLTKGNYLASPPLVVAFALAGTTDIDLTSRSRLAIGSAGNPSICATSGRRKRRSLRPSVQCVECGDVPRPVTATSSRNSPKWNAIAGAGREFIRGAEESSYVQEPPFLIDLAGRARGPIEPIRAPGRSGVGRFGDDRSHLARRGNRPDTPAGQYLQEGGVPSRRTSTATVPAAATTGSWFAARSPTSACATCWPRAPKAASKYQGASNGLARAAT